MVPFCLCNPCPLCLSLSTCQLVPSCLCDGRGVFEGAISSRIDGKVVGTADKMIRAAEQAMCCGLLSTGRYEYLMIQRRRRIRKTALKESKCFDDREKTASASVDD